MPETLLDQDVAASAAWTDILYVVADPTGTPADKQITKEALFEAALKALAGLTPAPDTIPYFSSGSAAGLVTIGSGLTFVGGTLTATAAGAAWGDITGTLADQADLEAALAGKQPIDADLTAIAALATDAFGRVLLTKTTGAEVRDYIFAMQRISWGNYSGDITSQTGAGANMDATAASRTVTLNSTPDTCGILAVRCAATSGTNTVTIAGSGGWTIDGAASITLSQAGEFVVLEAVNADSKWRIISDGRYGTRPLKWATVSTSGTRAVGYVYDCSGTNTQTLPVAAAGETIGFCMRGTPGDVVTIAPSGGGTVGGSSSITLTCVASSVREFVLLSARASNEWEIVADGRRSIANGQLVANTARLLGRSTSGVGVVEELTVGTGLSLSGGALACTVSGGGLAIQSTQTASFTAVAGRRYPIDLSGAGADFVVTFPGSPSAGDTFSVFVKTAHSSNTYCGKPLSSTSIRGSTSHDNKWGVFMLGEELVFRYDGATWQVESDGRIPFHAKMYRGTTQPINGTTFTKVNLTSEVFDNGNFADSTTNYRVTVKRVGTYRVSARHLFATMPSAVTYLLTDIYINGTRTYSYGDGHSVAAPTLTDSCVVAVHEDNYAVNDYIELGVFHTFSSARDTSTTPIGRPELVVEELLR